MRISDWSSDVCSSDLALALFSIVALTACNGPNQEADREQDKASATARGEPYSGSGPNERIGEVRDRAAAAEQNVRDAAADALKRSEEHTSEPQSLMRSSYAVSCLHKKNREIE